MKVIILLSFLLFASTAIAKEDKLENKDSLEKKVSLEKKDSLEVDATRINANKDLPKVLYVVPWKDMETTKNTDQKLVLHDFFGDLYDPVLASGTPHSLEIISTPADSNLQ